MPKVVYTDTTKLEAVALARVVGIRAAAQQLEIDWRTVRDWVALAGDAPEFRGTAQEWESIRAVASSRVLNLVSTGKLTASQLAIVSGIAERNLRELAKLPQPEPPPEPSVWDDVSDGALVAALVALDDIEDDAPLAETWPQDFLATYDPATWTRPVHVFTPYIPPDVAELLEQAKAAIA